MLQKTHGHHHTRRQRTCFSATSAARRKTRSALLNGSTSHSDTFPTMQVVHVRLSTSMSLRVSVPVVVCATCIIGTLPRFPGERGPSP